MLQICCWNINSIRSRITQLLSMLEENKPDIVLLQEIKCLNDDFPKDAIEDLGYNLAIHGQKSYNGVAILSKYPMEDISSELPFDPDNTHSRYIEAVISVRGKVIRVASVYVPNGQEVGSEKFKYKLEYLDALHAHFKNLLTYDEILVIGGDFNVAPEEIDVYNPKLLKDTLCFHHLEREKFRALKYLGLTDAYREFSGEKSEFSWWDYRAGAFTKNQGMRIDHFLLSPEASDAVHEVYIDKNMRLMEKPSDHAPINCILDI